MQVRIATVLELFIDNLIKGNCNWWQQTLKTILKILFFNHIILVSTKWSNLRYKSCSRCCKIYKLSLTIL